MVQGKNMPSFSVQTAARTYDAIVERGILAHATNHLPSQSAVVITTEDVWDLHGGTLQRSIRDRVHKVLFFAGGEHNKRMSEVERLAGEMIDAGCDRSSIVIAFGGGIVNDVGGFVAACFMLR